MREHIVYKTVNIDTNQFYIGVHSGENASTDDYLGSGNRIRASVRKYGRSLFKREVLRICSTRAEALVIESELVTTELLRDPLCLNITVGGKGNPNGNTSGTFIGKTHTELSKRMISESLKGRPAPNKGKPWTLEQREKLTGRTASNKGVPMTEEQKVKLRSSNQARLKPVVCAGVKYNSIGDAIRTLNMHRSSIMAKLNSPTVTDWYYVNCIVSNGQ